MTHVYMCEARKSTAEGMATSYGYMVHGALSTLQRLPAAIAMKWIKDYSGEIGVAIQFLPYAWHLQDLWEKGNEEGKSAQGMWDYEISEPFGEWFINTDPTHEEALVWLERAVKEQFGS